MLNTINLVVDSNSSIYHDHYFLSSRLRFHETNPEEFDKEHGDKVA